MSPTTMLKQFGVSLAALAIAWPCNAYGQSQQTKVPVATIAATKTSSVKTRQKRARMIHPSAADRGLTPNSLTKVVLPNGEIRVTRKKKTLR